MSKEYLKVKWKTETCNSGAKCWCRIIVPVGKQFTSEDYIIADGSIEKTLAKHIIEIHNKYIEENI